MAPRRKNIPDGWFDFDPIKEVIDDLKIVPFKVPLPDRRFVDDPMKRHKWTPSDVLNRIPNLGLIIDLTFKHPCYYDPVEFSQNGVKYIKIGCVGHDIPPKETFLKFCDTIDAFLQENTGRLVGVHCTHGVNRTGYMICRYMIERRGYTADRALEVFASKRGYPINRDNYLKEIRENA